MSNFRVYNGTKFAAQKQQHHWYTVHLNYLSAYNKVAKAAVKNYVDIQAMFSEQNAMDLCSTSTPFQTNLVKDIFELLRYIDAHDVDIRKALSKVSLYFESTQLVHF